MHGHFQTFLMHTAKLYLRFPECITQTVVGIFLESLGVFPVAKLPVHEIGLVSQSFKYL